MIPEQYPWKLMTFKRKHIQMQLLRYAFQLRKDALDIFEDARIILLEGVWNEDNDYLIIRIEYYGKEVCFSNNHYRKSLRLYNVHTKKFYEMKDMFGSDYKVNFYYNLFGLLPSGFRVMKRGDSVKKYF